MAVNPTQWLSSTMQACCKKFFGGYNYDSCMGRYPPDHDDCNVMLYYPDWNGANKGCIDDGKQDIVRIYFAHEHAVLYQSLISHTCLLARTT